ncbi:MAG: malto-oligosyltrehalose trehalohydrolase [Candidatus Macondimonas sp.]|jgi:malto-oligosyltrehalose trehalohydrolase
MKDFYSSEHEMPFGPQRLADGRMRFRLWAPGQDAPKLQLFDGLTDHLLPMQARGEGWFDVITDRARTGQHYCFRLDSGLAVPDPASRFQPRDVHGPSELIDPAAYRWQHDHWRGRPWGEAVIYELHVGSFSPEGNYQGIIDRLDYLAELGVTALELMPLADFPGQRNWGYDGVLPFAPDSVYGRPEDLKRLIDAAHGHGLMVLLDVVYNHFGPDGNYLGAYAPSFFTARHNTLWGDAINFDDDDSASVRAYFIHNALYWLEEYRFDGLRLDAVHAIRDDSEPHILEALAEAVRGRFGRAREAHLILENDANQARFLARDSTGRPHFHTAQWNDDFHHAAHVLATGEEVGYYRDFAAQPLQQLARCLTEGFAYQDDPSPFRNGEHRGEPSAHLPPTAFVNFLQNHDQIGNRALGERLTQLAPAPRLRALTEILLLAPSPPLLFMGQEWGSQRPFLFFCDFAGELGAAVSDGRRKEFAAFPAFADAAVRARIPDPTSPETFAASRLDWSESHHAENQQWLALHRQLLALRARHIAPLLALDGPPSAEAQVSGSLLRACWRWPGAVTLTLVANLSDKPAAFPAMTIDEPVIYHSAAVDAASDRLPPWSVVWWRTGAEH